MSPQQESRFVETDPAAFVFGPPPAAVPAPAPSPEPAALSVEDDDADELEGD